MMTSAEKALDRAKKELRKHKRSNDPLRKVWEQVVKDWEIIISIERKR